MKNFISLLFIIFVSGTFSVSAQDEVEELLAAGVDDAQRFAQSYLKPANDALVYGLSNGWYNSGGPQKQFGFEISAIVNATFIGDDAQSFTLDINDYENLRFLDGSTTQEVATAFGDINTITAVVEGPLPGAIDDVTIDLPSGFGDESTINFIPTAVIQGSFNILKGTSIKARFFPNVETDDVEIGLYGVGIQQDFTAWLPADKIIPIAISGVIGYTRLDATFNFDSTAGFNGADQRLESTTNSWVFEAVASTKLPVFNVYGGVGYVTGNSETALLGTYEINSGVISGQTLVDPFTTENTTSGVRGTVGFKLKLGFFRLNADYTLAEFNNATVGINFGFR